MFCKPLALWGWAILLACLGMCWNHSAPAQGQSPITTGFGRVRGGQYATSVNGMAMLKHYLESRSYEVVVKRAITPSIEKADVVIWAPDSWHAPSEEVVTRLNQWLTGGQYRTLVYIGRDYDAAVEYWQSALEQSETGGPRELVLRELSQTRLNQMARPQRLLAADECAWFTIEACEPGAATARFVSNVDDESGIETEIVWGTSRLIPRSGTAHRIRPLMETDANEVFAFELELKANRTNRILVVSNGSLLLNFPFALEKRRPVAERFLDLATENATFQGRIQLLESGPQEPIISNSDNVGGQLAWIVEAPLKYIVPQVVILGVMYCFVVFPILGRPKRLVTQTESRFGRHLEALGRMWSRSGRMQEPREAIERFRRSVENK